MVHVLLVETVIQFANTLRWLPTPEHITSTYEKFQVTDTLSAKRSAGSAPCTSHVTLVGEVMLVSLKLPNAGLLVIVEGSDAGIINTVRTVSFSSIRISAGQVTSRAAASNTRKNRRE